MDGPTRSMGQGMALSMPLSVARRAARLAVFALTACAGTTRPHPFDANLAGAVLPALPSGAQAPSTPPAELDPAVRSGVLANGLTYFVMRREQPLERAALWLAVDAGSVLEDDDQRGVAHFVEHMAFNGTTHFPKHSIVDFVERAGMRVGADVNAYTNFDQTVYEFTVPTERGGLVVTQGLDILHDIAQGVTFEPAEVERERPVIQEEWRVHRGAHERARDERNPLLFAASRYAVRDPIGQMDTIRTVPATTLKRFYADWYRPNLMGVIAVGDLDVDAVEQSIRGRFADLKNPETPRPRPTVTVPTSGQTELAVLFDSELPTPEARVFDRVPRRPQATIESFRERLVEDIFLSIMRERLDTLTETPGSVLLQTGVARTSLSRGLEAFVYSFTPRNEKVENGLFVVMYELERLARYGVRPEELERARKELRDSWEARIEYGARGPHENKARELVRHLFENEEVIGGTRELEALQRMLPTITLADVGRVAKDRARVAGRVVSIDLPSRPTVPPVVSTVHILEHMAADSPVEPWHASAPKGPLVPAPPVGGTIIARAHDAGADADVWTLSNGVRVVVKPTAFSSGTVLVQGFQPGGTSLVSQNELLNARYAPMIVGADGAGTFSSRDLSALLAGSGIALDIGLGELEQHVDAKTRSSELATLFQYLYLRLTSPRADEFAGNGWKRHRASGAYRTEDAPDEYFRAEIFNAATRDHWRRRVVSRDVMNQVDGAAALALWKRLFANFRDFTFVIVGRFDVAELEPLVTTYLGSLPSARAVPRSKDLRITHPTGIVERTTHRGVDDKARFWLDFSGTVAYRPEREDDAKILTDILTLRLHEKLREEIGGIYAFDARAIVSRKPEPRRDLTIQFTCAPENVERLQRAIFDELSAMARSGVDDDMLERVRKRLERQDQLDRASDAWWLAQLADAYRYGDDFAARNDVSEKVARVTNAAVRRTAALMFDPHNYVRVVMLPEDTKGATPGR